MVDTLGVTPQEWFVVFEPKTSLWWGKYLSPGFGHCYMFGFVEDPGSDTGIWIFQEALIRGLFVGVARPEVVHGWLTLAHAGRLRILRVRPPLNEVVRPRFMVTCAGAIGAVLGLKRLPITPHGLFWALRKLGAVEVGRLEDGRSTEGTGTAGTDPGGAGAAADRGGSGGGCGEAGSGREAEGGAEPAERGAGPGGGLAGPSFLAVGGG